MAAFFFLYLFLIVYALAIRIASRKEVNSGHVDWVYKIQSLACVVITAVTSGTLSVLFGQSILDWVYQFIPAVIVATIVAADKPIDFSDIETNKKL